MKKLDLFLSLIMILAVLLVSACSQLQPLPVTGPTAPVQSGGSTETVSPAPSQSPTVTLDDRGKTIHLKVGERFLLKLGDAYDWQVEIDDQNVVSRVIGVMVVRGAQGLYQARQAGTATLKAAGDPPCRQSQPACAQPSIQFQVTIVVEQ